MAKPYYDLFVVTGPHPSTLQSHQYIQLTTRCNALDVQPSHHSSLITHRKISTTTPSTIKTGTKNNPIAQTTTLMFSPQLLTPKEEGNVVTTL